MQADCRDLLDAHVCHVHKTVMQYGIRSAADHTDQQVWKHAIL